MGGLTRPLSPKPFAATSQIPPKNRLDAILLADLICLFRWRQTPPKQSKEGLPGFQPRDPMGAGVDRVIGGAISSFIKRIVLPSGGGSSHRGRRGGRRSVEKGGAGRAWKGRRNDLWWGRESPPPPMLVASGNFLCLPHC